MEEIKKKRKEETYNVLYGSVKSLMGLDESLFGSAKPELLSLVPLPTLEETYNALNQDEESKLLEHLNDERVNDVSIQAAHLRNNSNRGRSVVCTVCGHNRHVADNYYHKIGYPP